MPPSLNFQAMAQLSQLCSVAAIALARLSVRTQSDDPKIHPRLTSSLSFGMHFNSECKTRRHTVLCHLFSQFERRTTGRCTVCENLRSASGVSELRYWDKRRNAEANTEHRRSSNWELLPSCHSALPASPLSQFSLLPCYSSQLACLLSSWVGEREREHLQME